jgi:hypothetical protein
MTVRSFVTVAGIPLTPTPSPARGEGRRFARNASLQQVLVAIRDVGACVLPPSPLAERGRG